MILCYDRSDASTEAIKAVAALLRGAPALVVSIWKPVAEEALSPAGKPPPSDTADVNNRSEEAALQVARAGAREASAAGLDAKPLAVEVRGRTWEAIAMVADDYDAQLIACGTSRAGVKSLLPGDLPGALVDHASVPVLVVPSSKAAAERRRDVQESRGARRHTGV
ncbi:MAG: universal stress protein [Solirubrobacterales bacterium]|nr:universal stress protein [Solirubrobacterales bacterium]